MRVMPPVRLNSTYCHEICRCQISVLSYGAKSGFYFSAVKSSKMSMRIKY